MFEKFNERRQLTPMEGFMKRYPEIDPEMEIAKPADLLKDTDEVVAVILGIFSFESVDSFTNKKEKKVALYTTVGKVVVHNTNKAKPFYNIDEDIQVATAIRKGLASVRIFKEEIVLRGEPAIEYKYEIQDTKKGA